VGVKILIDGASPARSRHAAVVAAHLPNPVLVGEFLEDTRRRLVADPFRSQLASVRALAERPFSYVDDHETVRGDVLQAIQHLPFRASVFVFAKEDPAARGKLGWRYRALARLSTQLKLGKLDRDAEVVIGTRMGPDVATIEEYVRLIRETPGAARLRKIPAPPMTIARGADPCSIVPEYVAGVFCDLYDGLTGERAPKGADPMRRYATIAAHVHRVSDCTKNIEYKKGAFSAELERLWYRS
jgi:hypothetical protein